MVQISFIVSFFKNKTKRSLYFSRCRHYIPNPLSSLLSDKIFTPVVTCDFGEDQVTPSFLFMKDFMEFLEVSFSLTQFSFR